MLIPKSHLASNNLGRKYLAIGRLLGLIALTLTPVVYGYDMMPPTQVLYRSSFGQGDYQDPHQACTKIADDLNLSQSKVAEYLNPRYGVRQNFGPGCYYDVRDVKTDVISRDVHYQNWVKPEYSCLPGYEGPFRIYNYHSWGDDICRQSSRQDGDAKVNTCPSQLSLQGYQAQFLPVEVPGIELGLFYYSKSSSQVSRSGLFGNSNWSSWLDGRLGISYSPVYSKRIAQLSDSEVEQHLFLEYSPGVFTAWNTALSLIEENGQFTLLDSLGRRRFYSVEGALIGYQEPGQSPVTVERHGKDADQYQAVYGMVKRVWQKGQAYNFIYQNRRLHKITWGEIEVLFTYEQDKLVSVTQGGQVTAVSYESDSPCLQGISRDGKELYFAHCSAQGQLLKASSVQGPLTYSYFPDGYDATNSLGKITRYRFSSIASKRRLVSVAGEVSPNCPASQRQLTYYTNGLLKSATDWKGVETQYKYNERGQQISRTEAAGTPQARTVTTDWHPTLFLPVTVTEPSRITHYTYDDQGRQLSQSVTQR